jgi:hypothetical protein
MLSVCPSVTVPNSIGPSLSPSLLVRKLRKVEEIFFVIAFYPAGKAAEELYILNVLCYGVLPHWKSCGGATY